MYQWYRDAKICYAYLADVPPDAICQEAGQYNFAPVLESEWFQRGWTLQELLAPDDVVFLSSDWTTIGTRMDGEEPGSLRSAISDGTGIRIEALAGFDPQPARTGQSSVAERLSWASRRKTTKVEDAAYCLLGIFNIAVPLLYGEGKEAFQRLQREILQRELGDSVFAFVIVAGEIYERA